MNMGWLKNTLIGLAAILAIGISSQAPRIINDIRGYDTVLIPEIARSNLAEGYASSERLNHWDKIKVNSRGQEALVLYYGETPLLLTLNPATRMPEFRSYTINQN